MSEPTVAASNASYQIGGVSLVEGIDLEVSAGELVAIIGPNGAGKSTLLGLLSGDLRASGGQVLLNGIDVATALPGDLSLMRSILTQHELVEVPYTAAQLVEMGRFPHRHDPSNTTDQDSAAVMKAMEQTDTTRFAQRAYATLSRGEQTRVSLARVIARQRQSFFSTNQPLALTLPTRSESWSGSPNSPEDKEQLSSSYTTSIPQRYTQTASSS